ncbi:MAG: hypothetical protein ACYCXA_15690, partial [Actinomycetes bacterium]
MAGGEVVAAVSGFLHDLQASGRTSATQRSYALDLLRWPRCSAGRLVDRARVTPGDDGDAGQAGDRDARGGRTGHAAAAPPLPAEAGAPVLGRLLTPFAPHHLATGL